MPEEGRNRSRIQVGTRRFSGEFLETYSAFANTKGGVIVLGVKEKNHRFTPDGFTDELVDKYKKTFWDCANNKVR